MKFLCVPCDSPMKLLETRGPDGGSMALVYSCPACGYEFAMHTNPLETQLVASLGVEIGPGGSRGESKCPFSGVAREMAEAAEHAEATGVRWSDGARRRLEGIPEFVRPMAKTGIEKYARDRGYGEVDDAVLDEARQFFGM